MWIEEKLTKCDTGEKGWKSVILRVTCLLFFDILVATTSSSLQRSVKFCFNVFNKEILEQKSSPRM